MLNYQPAAMRGVSPAPYRHLPAHSMLGQNGAPVAVAPSGPSPMVTSGILLTLGGLVSGAVGTYLALKGSRVIGKKVPTFWQWYFGTGGIGATMAILGAIPLVALGVLEIAGGTIIQKKIEEAAGAVQAPR